MRENRAYHKLKRTFPTAHWQRVETWVTPGIFDTNACFVGVEVWVECKQTARPKTSRGKLHFDIKKEQIVWELKRRMSGGRTFVAIMVDSTMYLLPGRLIGMLSNSVHEDYLIQHCIDHRRLFNEA
jgi:hypothetical protein